MPHFADTIHTWEIWNEPNAYTSYSEQAGYTGSSFIYPSNFAWLLAQVYPICDASGVQCISGGLFGHDLVGVQTMVEGQRVTKRGIPARPAYRVMPEASRHSGPSVPLVTEATIEALSGAEYLRNTYEMGIAYADWRGIKARSGSYPLDGVGQHIYIDQNATTTAAKIGDYLNSVRNTYTSGKYEGGRTNKLTFVTEFGWPANPALDIAYQTRQADNLSIAYEAFRNTAYVKTACWFQLSDNISPEMHYGLRYPSSEGSGSDWLYKPAWDAYQFAAFGGSTNSPPSASFTFTCTDLTCDFDGSGSSDSDSDGSITTYAWDFGDESTGTGVTPSHTYAAGGSYTVILTVTDDVGATDTVSQSVTVSAPSTGGITLSATGYKERGQQKANLEWRGAASTNVDVFRDGTLVATTANDNAYTDHINNVGGGSYTYQVCEAGSTLTCSNEAKVTF
jgi:PKD repeat protein